MPEDILNNENEVVDNDVSDVQDKDDVATSGEEDLIAALKSLNQQNFDEEEPVDNEEEPVDNEENSEDEETENQEGQEDEEVLAEEDQKPKKKVQSKEENARFAAMRRQREMEQKIQAEIERLKQEAPEFQIAHTLSEMYGMTPEELLQQLQEAKLQKEAQEKGVPIEFLRERLLEQQRLNQLEEELNRLRFQQWQSRIEAESLKLKQEYNFLTDDDIQEAVDYILNVAQNVDLPLEHAVFAVHGKKIAEALANAKLQEQLAADSGRKKTPITPKSGKTSQTRTATAEERYIAQQLGMSVDEYLKYKYE